MSHLNVHCFFIGHEEIPEGAISEFFPELIKVNGLFTVIPNRRIICAHCKKIVGVEKYVEPLVEDAHRVLLAERWNLFDPHHMYQAVCWCGWRGRWHAARGDALQDKYDHLIAWIKACRPELEGV